MGGGELSGLICNPAIVLPWSLRLRLARDLLMGIAYLHSQGVIHRDVKADNALVSEEDDLPCSR